MTNPNYVDLFSDFGNNMHPGSYARSLLKETYIRCSLPFKRGSNDNFLRLIYCHHVFDDQVEQFQKLIEELLKDGEFVSSEKCLDIIQGKVELDGRYYHISFDDGFKNIYKNALPILKLFNIPSLFFVPTSLIEAPFNVVKDYCLNTLRLKSPLELVTWSDLECMADCNMDIGSHTKHHVDLASISNNNDILLDEVLGSKEELEKRLGVKALYFSWPFGEKKHIDHKSIDCIKNSGYSACFSAIRGDVEPIKTDIFYIPRNHFEVEWSWASKEYFLL